MRIISFLIIGALAGWISGELVFGDGFGLIGNLAVGIVGSVVGGVVLDLAGKQDKADGFIPELITSVLGAVILLFFANLLF